MDHKDREFTKAFLKTGSKNHVMEIEKLMRHHSATKERIKFG